MTSLSEQTTREPCAWKRASTVRRGAIGNVPVTGNALVAYSTYEYRQVFIHERRYLNYNEVQKRLQSHEAYKALPAKVSQQILMVLDNNWKSFREALKAYYEDLSRFFERPPKYKHKTEGRNILVYTIQVLRGGQSKKGIQGCIRPSRLPIEVKTQQKHVDQVRIIPRNGHYLVEVIYSKEPVQAQVDLSFCVAIDLGVTNLAAITSNRVGFIPQNDTIAKFLVQHFQNK
jgi:putative transposase